MLRLVARRAWFSLLVLLVVSLAIFLLTHIVPGSPAIIVLGADASADQVRAFERQYGLDRPLAAQYLSWIAGVVLRGDFGRSYISGQPIAREVARTLPVTLEIIVLAFVFCQVVAVPLGIVSALYQGRLVDHVARVVAVAGVSVPGFWLGLMLIVYASVHWRLFPPGGFIPWSAGVWPHLQSVILPALSLGIYYTAIISRMTRSCMIDVASQDYVRTARAMGLSRARVLGYALKNALIPVVSVSAMSIGYMFGWAIVIEQVFNIAGLSRALLSAIFERDYYTVQAIVLVITAVFIIANFVADLVFRALNPRLRGAAA
jgi:peptide/nickel transport system permease protein